MARDKRLGISNGEKGREYPLLTLGGHELSAPPYETVGIGEGYFAVLDPYMKPAKRDELVTELQGIVKGYSVPKVPSKTVESPKSE